MGPLFIRTCENCRNKSWWVYGMVGGTKLSINFIPVGTPGARPAALCAVCDRGFALVNDGEKLAQELARMNRAYNSGNMSDDDYGQQCRANPLWLAYADQEASLPPHKRWDGSRWVSSDGRYFWDGEKWERAGP